MYYKCNYKTNPIFPYENTSHKIQRAKSCETTSFHKTTDTNFNIPKFLDNFLYPIEKIIGRKICFDDIVLIALIYILYTEKNDENNTLLLCLVFILFS